MKGLLAAVAVIVAAVLGGCSRGPVPPAALDARSETCAYCRMVVSDPRFAGQLVAPWEEPRFFDDLGCLRDFLREHTVAPRAIAYVADHRTKAWVRARSARYARAPALATPMGSHLVAHADEASRAADPDAAGATALLAAEVFAPGLPPDGGP